jgi:hypothetical protein
MARIDDTGRCALTGPPTHRSRFPRKSAAKGHSASQPEYRFCLEHAPQYKHDRRRDIAETTQHFACSVMPLSRVRNAESSVVG